MGWKYRTNLLSSNASRIRPTHVKASNSRFTRNRSAFSSVMSRNTTTAPSTKGVDLLE
jgi:hypothetical protein